VSFEDTFIIQEEEEEEEESGAEKRQRPLDPSVTRVIEGGDGVCMYCGTSEKQVLYHKCLYNSGNLPLCEQCIRHCCAE